jgi:hypothetical protein
MEDGCSGREMWVWEVFWRDRERYMDIGKWVCVINECRLEKDGVQNGELGG